MMVIVWYSLKLSGLLELSQSGFRWLYRLATRARNLLR